VETYRQGPPACNQSAQQLSANVVDVHHRLKPIKQVGWNAGKPRVSYRERSLATVHFPKKRVVFPENCFRRTEVKCIKKLALVHEFGYNVAVVALTVVSITTGIVQFQAK